MVVETPAFGQAPPAAPPSQAPVTPPSLGDALTGQAKSEYDTARILFDSGDYSGALVKFQHAYDLSQDARLLWNMAACEKSLRAYARVLRLVERYLHDGGPLLTEAQRDDATAVLRTVRTLVTSVRLIVNESGASVFVDGEPVGTTPLADPLLVDLGERHIRVTKPGFKEQVITQNAAGASEATVSIALEREAQEGHLSISTAASGAILVDGAAVGVGRWEGAVAPGTHSISITAPGMRAYSSVVAVREGESRTVEVDLQRESSGIPAIVWIAGGVLAAAGLGVGGYFLFRPSQSAPAPTAGTIPPFTLMLQSWR
ncbi:MAG: PEGA domain-containing protein [Polyangiaceae bacterium]